MGQKRQVSERSHCNAVLIVIIVLSGLLSTHAYAASTDERVRLQLKAQSGDSFEFEFKLSGRTSGYAGRALQIENEDVFIVEVYTTVESIKRNGRMSLRNRVQRVRARTIVDGNVQVDFDSARPDDVKAAKNHPSLSYALKLLESDWQVQQDPNGEILDYSVHTPGGESDIGAKLYSRETLKVITYLTSFSFPSYPVGPGESWEGNIINRLPAERHKAAMTYTLKEIRKEDGETIALIGFKRSGTLPWDQEPGIRRKSSKYDDNGFIIFAIERGRVKSANIKYRTIDVYQEKKKTTSVHIEQELTVKEIRP